MDNGKIHATPLSISNVSKTSVHDLFAKMRKIFLHYEYLDTEKLQGFAKYKYKGVDVNPINNKITMPLCDKIVALLPPWLPPNALTLTTFFISLLQFLILSYFDYRLHASAGELIEMDRIPNWVWFFSGSVLVACIILDAIDGKHARRIGACSPVGEILDHCIDTWRLTAPALVCFYSIFGRLEYGVPGYRLTWLLVATQSVIVAMFWQQYVSGVMVYNWGYDIMQYTMAGFYFLTWSNGDADVWQCEGYWFGTNAVITEKWAHLMIFGVSLPMQFYYFLKYQLSSDSKPMPLRDFVRPVVAPLGLFATAIILTQRNLFDSVLEEDTRASMWLHGIVFCDMMWRLLIAIMTRTKCPIWNRLLTFYIVCTFYWYVRPRSLLPWDRFTVQIAASAATFVHLHLVLCTLNQMCEYFGIYLLSLHPRKQSENQNGERKGVLMIA